MTQDGCWLAKYNEVEAFVVNIKRRPSKYVPEERNAWNWMRHTQKQYSAGGLKPDRVEKLMRLCQENKHVNQYV